MKRFLLSVCLALTTPGAILVASTPDWARPYLEAPPPREDYIAKSDEWITLYWNIEVGAAPSGGLSLRHRVVLAPAGGKARRLRLRLRYDEVTQTLVEPHVWVPRSAAGYRELKLLKHSVNTPDLQEEIVTSRRGLVITTEEIEEDQKAIVSWQIDDRRLFPGEDTIFPFWDYPVVEFQVRAAAPSPGTAIRITRVEPRRDGPPVVREGPVDFVGLPALPRLGSWESIWTTSIREILPHVIVRAGPEGSPSWKGLARDVSSLFQSALGTDAVDGRRARVDSITRGATTTTEKAARLAGFVQSLTDRNFEWGEGDYTPESPGETLRTMSADCKGKVLLLQTMLQDVGVASRPVLCYSGGHYLDTLPFPTVQAFNHAVLAIHLPGLADRPAELLEGPGKGWILFDPTDPVSVLGRPPENLEGTRALWIDPAAGDLFAIHTLESGGQSSVARLRMSIGGTEEAAVDLILEGYGDLLREVGGQRIYGGDLEKFRARCQEMLQGVAPGLQINDAKFVPPDHPGGNFAHLEIRGRMRSPLQPLGRGTFSLPSPLALTGQLLGIPRHGYKKGLEPAEADRVVASQAWRPERCCLAVPGHLRAEIRLTLPDGWTVQWPTREINAPWLRERVENEPAWAVTIEWPRGRFPQGSGTHMLDDFNSVASLFRQSLLVTEPAREDYNPRDP